MTSNRTWSGRKVVGRVQVAETVLPTTLESAWETVEPPTVSW